MQKLIKLSDTHYVIVDDSEIKEGDYAIHKNKEYREKYKAQPIICNESNQLSIQEHWRKITHSTQPLEEDVEIMGSIPKITLRFVKIKPLPLSEVEEVVYGYNVDYLAANQLGEHKHPAVGGHEAYVRGFNAHKELVKGKLFIDKKDLKPLLNLLDEGYDPYDTYHHLQVKRILRTVESFVESLLPKTEWDCRVVNSKIDLI